VIPGAVASFYRVLCRYDEVGGKYLAASLSFYALMSFIPLLFTILNLFGYIIGRTPEAEESVISSILATFPGAGRVLAAEVRRVVEHSAVGWVSLIIFIWIGALVFGSLEHAMQDLHVGDPQASAGQDRAEVPYGAPRRHYDGRFVLGGLPAGDHREIPAIR
jgi:uncharacterized BrkB/YihY/UPF0761 family membrane protein